MDFEALISTLEALLSNLKSTEIRDINNPNDFEKNVVGFEAMVSDLKVMSKDNNNFRNDLVQKKLMELEEILVKLDHFSEHQLNILNFVKDIVPTK